MNNQDSVSPRGGMEISTGEVDTPGRQYFRMREIFTVAEEEELQQKFTEGRGGNQCREIDPN
jgi:hypothetical protein